MAWRPLLSWIMSSSSSSSSSSSDYESDHNNNVIEYSEANNNVQPVQSDEIDEHDDDDDDDVSYEPEEDEEAAQYSNNSNSTSTSDMEPRAKRRRIDYTNEALMVPVQEDTKRRRKKVWSKEDELELLRGFLDYYSRRGRVIRKRTTIIRDTATFYDEIRPKLKVECDKAQMVQKLSRLKRKYHDVVKKMNDMNSRGKGKEFGFRTPHDKDLFELSRKIWKAQESNVGDSHEDYYATNSKCALNLVGTSSSVGDHERPQNRHMWSQSKLTAYNESNFRHDGLNDYVTTSLLKDNNVDDNDLRGLIIGLAMNPMPMSLSKTVGNGVEMVDEEWRKQQILELEAYSKRLDLVQHQVKAALEDMKSKGPEQN